MAIIIKKQDFIYSENVKFVDEKTGASLYELRVEIDSDNAQKLKKYVRDVSEKTPKYDDKKEEEVRRIIFGENYDEALAHFGEFYMDEFTAAVFAGVLGKLNADSTRNIESAISKYQKNTKKPI